MPVHAITHSVLGLHNNTNPCWDLGAILYWSSRHGRKLQFPGGSYEANVTQPTGERFDMLPVTYLASTPEMFFEPGQNKFVQFAGSPTVAQFPKGGDFMKGQTNRWTFLDTMQDRRGFTADAGLSEDVSLLIETTATPYAGNEANKLYLQSGQFTSTLKTSEDVTAIDVSPQGISYDLTNTPWAGTQAKKLYLQSGQFTSTLKTSEAVGGIDDEPFGISWDGTNTPWAGGEFDKLHLQSGQFTSTLKTSEDVSGIDGQCQGISWDGTNTPWAAGVSDNLILQSGQFTSTVKTSLDVSPPDSALEDISWDGVNTPWIGATDDKLYLQSGQFTSTLKTSEFTGGIDNAAGAICTDNVDARLGLIVGGTGAQEIMSMLDGGPADTYKVSNFSGVTQRILRQQVTITGDHVFGFLCRRIDRGTIDTNTLDVRIEDGVSTDISTGSTVYRRLTGNGWYWVQRTGSQVGTTWTYIIDIKAGITNLIIDAPFVSSSATDPLMGAPFEPTGSSTFRDDFNLTAQNFDYTLTRGGWMGCCIVPPYPSGTDYPVSVVLSIDDTTTDERLRFNISSSSERPIFIYDAAGGTVGNSLALDVSEFQQGVPLGMVVTWGFRNGTLTYTFFVNGRQIGILSSLPIEVPTIKNTGQLQIGHQGTTISANVYVQAVSWGNKRIPRKIGRTLSRWFKRQAQDVVQSGA